MVVGKAPELQLPKVNYIKHDGSWVQNLCSKYCYHDQRRAHRGGYSYYCSVAKITYQERKAGNNCQIRVLSFSFFLFTFAL